jgi:succinate dehydrogenase/fumarate reductase flavoprotein subunit
MTVEKTIETDVLVIGGGIAGCFAAIKAKERGLDVTIVDKAYATKSGGTISATAFYMVFNPEWGHNLDACMNVIGKSGEYLNDHEWTETVLKESWGTYLDMVSWGVEFPMDIDKVKKEKSTLTLANSAGEPTFGQIPIQRGKHSPVLRKQAIKTGVHIMDRIMVTDLLKQDGKVTGALGFSLSGNDLYLFKAKATILCTGVSSFKPLGYATSALTGDGDAMAYRAGAAVTGKEFPAPFLTMAAFPAWRTYPGYGAYPNFTDAEGNPIKHVGFWDLAMDFLVHSGKGPILWNLDSATAEDAERVREWIRRAEGNVLAHERIGLDVSKGGKIQMAGGAGAGSSDSQTGGVWTVNTHCATEVPGLFVAGECCGTRYVGAVHTAGGFGLTGSAVTGLRAGLGAAEYASKVNMPASNQEEFTRLKEIAYAPVERKGGFSPAWLTQLLQNLMIPYFVSRIKNEERLKAALTFVEFFRDHMIPKLTAADNHELRMAHETRNMGLNAEMILRASLSRTESRGQHYREDHPLRDDPAWLAWLKVRNDQGTMKVIKEQIPEKWWPDLSIPYETRYPKRFLGE